MTPVLINPHMDHQLNGFRPWQDFVAMNFPWLEMKQGYRSDFQAHVKLARFGERSLATIRSNACRITRSVMAVNQADAGHVKVFWQSAGTMSVEQDGREILLSAGMATICDTGRPYRLNLSEDTQHVVMTMPYSAVVGWERISQRLCATHLPDRSVVNASLAVAKSLLDDAEVGQAGDADPVLQAVQWMLSASLQQMAAPDRMHAGLKFDFVHQHILAHISDPELCPDELAGALHVSRRTLYQLFKTRDITPGRFIRDIRLEAARQALMSAHNIHRSIFEIAADFGFTDSAIFSRVFKATYGMSPSACREGELSTQNFAMH